MEGHFKQTVIQNWFALKYVPFKFRTLELCEIAMKQNKKAIEFVPEELKNYFLPKEENQEVETQVKEAKTNTKKSKSK